MTSSSFPPKLKYIHIFSKKPVSETLPDSFTASSLADSPIEKKKSSELIFEILTEFEKHYILHMKNYDNNLLKTRDIMNKITSDISIYKTRNLLLRLEEQGYIFGIVIRGTQGLHWQLTYKYREKVSEKTRE